jgi:hypothetical protein
MRTIDSNPPFHERLHIILVLHLHVFIALDGVDHGLETLLHELVDGFGLFLRHKVPHGMVEHVLAEDGQPRHAALQRLEDETVDVRALCTHFDGLLHAHTHTK